MRTRFVVRGSRTHKALEALSASGGMPTKDFRALLASLCPTKAAAFELRRRLHEHGYIEHFTRLTATGSVQAAAANDRKKTPGDTK